MSCFELMEKERDPRVLELIIHGLCQHPHWSSSRKFLNLITSLNDFLDIQANLKAVFMVCAIAAINPCLRRLVIAALDNLSKELKYTSRSKEV
ncbi:hypothetical protein HAX54_028137 [Datura stramonium]|uniref:Uncharacterized protein n=1 Tax=Datura stramonium TaxID=4076 RepID=A0ABS8S9D3_DATST|nr:hypothetical protein [Datura stramonium]